MCLKRSGFKAIKLSTVLKSPWFWQRRTINTCEAGCVVMARTFLWERQVEFGCFVFFRHPYFYFFFFPLPWGDGCQEEWPMNVPAFRSYPHCQRMTLWLSKQKVKAMKCSEWWITYFKLDSGPPTLIFMWHVRETKAICALETKSIFLVEKKRVLQFDVCIFYF